MKNRCMECSCPQCEVADAERLAPYQDEILRLKSLLSIHPLYQESVSDGTTENLYVCKLLGTEVDVACTIQAASAMGAAKKYVKNKMRTKKGDVINIEVNDGTVYTYYRITIYGIVAFCDIDVS